MGYGDRVGGVTTGLAAAGVDHVRLSYHYLDDGDTDGYASLLDPGAVFEEPGREPVRGRCAVAGLHRKRGLGKHHIDDVFAVDGRVTAVGRLCGASGDEVSFADVFTLSEHGLLARQRRFYFIRPV